MQGPGRIFSDYVKSIPNKDRGHDPVPRNKSNKQQENNAIVNIAVDERLLHENKKLSAEKEAHGNIESNIDESKLYQVENMILEYTKKT